VKTVLLSGVTAALCLGRNCLAGAKMLSLDKQDAADMLMRDMPLWLR
jgi:hypothetical protein